MIILGLTGSIAMGKSTVAEMFADHNIPVCDADHIVHHLLSAKGGAVDAIAARFPDAYCPDTHSIDRAALGRIVFADAAARVDLEGILHPLVRQHRLDWLADCRNKGADYAVLDIPLLFETGAEQDCDYTVLASSRPYLQRYRALLRPNMTAARFDAIVQIQMPDDIKRKRCDFIIPTSYGRGVSRWYISHCLAQLAQQEKY